MTFRNRLAVALGRGARYFLTRFTQGGSSLPGKLALKIAPNILEDLSRNYEVIIVTGTNGKTLTTALATAVAKAGGYQVLSNSSGSNMQQGIVTTFLGETDVSATNKALAILEVDEGSLKHVVDYLQPIAFVHTNIFPDQLDRFASTDQVYQLLVEAAQAVPEATVIINADLPMLVAGEYSNHRLYYGFAGQALELATNDLKEETCPVCGQSLVYKGVSYAQQGDYYCENCDFQRPQLDFSLEEIVAMNMTDSEFVVDGQGYSLPYSGQYNLYNALAAYSVGRFLGISQEAIARGLTNVKSTAGRQELIQIAGKSVYLNLVKNPVGMNQVLDLIAFDQKPISLIILQNNNYADGQDPDWIWQAQLEKLKDYDLVDLYLGGSQVSLLANRLAELNLSVELECLDDIQQIPAVIARAQTDRIHLIASYTAMQEVMPLLKG